MVEDKYIGLALAITSTLAIGASFIITKKGLNEASQKHGFEGEGFVYLKNPTWWGGMVTMVVGEIANFAAYAFAPAVLVTPLGALSVLIGAVLGSYFLNERLGLLGKIGCANCLIGSLIIVLHAPADKDIQRISEILQYALQPSFMIYAGLMTAYATVASYKIAPKYGKKNPLIYLSICSTVGSLSIMAVKAFGIAVKLTLGGKNQFVYPSTYVFAIIMIVCILTQMNYLNKALSQFPTSIVNPLYYVTFTTFTLIASALMFSGFNTTSPVNTISLLCGFLVTFAGVYLLNLSQEDPDGKSAISNSFSDAPPTDGIGAYTTRRSMQARRSSVESGHWAPGRRSTSDREGLMRGFDLEQAAQNFSLGDLAEDSDEETGRDGSGKRTSFDDDATKRGAVPLAGLRSPALDSNKELRSPKTPTNR